MAAFSALLAICAGNSPVTRTKASDAERSFDVSFGLCPNNIWVNSRDAGDLSHHRAHYDVIVMVM